MDCNHPDTPKTQRLIATLLAEHKNCPVKGHLLVVTDDKQVLLKHHKERCSSDSVIATLNPRHIHIGLSARQWNDFSQAIIAVIQHNGTGDTNTSLFQ